MPTPGLQAFELGLELAYLLLQLLVLGQQRFRNPHVIAAVPAHRGLVADFLGAERTLHDGPGYLATLMVKVVVPARPSLSLISARIV